MKAIAIYLLALVGFIVVAAKIVAAVVFTVTVIIKGTIIGLIAVGICLIVIWAVRENARIHNIR